MTTVKLIVGVAILVLGAAISGSAQRRYVQNGYTYQQYYPPQQQEQQQRTTYQNKYPTSQSGVTVSEAQWVCKNPKTGDMMIIISEDTPAGNGQGQWQQQRPTGQPVQPSYPSYPQQPNYPQKPTYPTQPSGPTYPTQQPTAPTNPTQPPTAPTYPSNQPPNQGTPPSNGGEGVINIRFGVQ